MLQQLFKKKGCFNNPREMMPISASNLTWQKKKDSAKLEISRSTQVGALQLFGNIVTLC
jgi:hypothetical protein